MKLITSQGLVGRLVIATTKTVQSAKNIAAAIARFIYAEQKGVSSPLGCDSLRKQALFAATSVSKSFR
jgi:hypothetical protein